VLLRSTRVELLCLVVGLGRDVFVFDNWVCLSLVIGVVWVCCGVCSVSVWVHNWVSGGLIWLIYRVNWVDVRHLLSIVVLFPWLVPSLLGSWSSFTNNLSSKAMQFVAKTNQVLFIVQD